MMQPATHSIPSSPRHADDYPESFVATLLPLSQKNSAMSISIFKMHEISHSEMERQLEPAPLHKSPNLSLSNSLIENRIPNFRLDPRLEPAGYHLQLSSENDSNESPRENEIEYVCIQKPDPLFVLDLNRRSSPIDYYHSQNHVVEADAKVFGRLDSMNTQNMITPVSNSITEILQCRKPLPPLCPEFGNEPIYVNAKQYNRIKIMREKKLKAGRLRAGNYVLERPRTVN